MGVTHTNNSNRNITTSLPVWRWNSPTPYLFSAVVLLMGCIAAALLMLACSYRKHLHRGSISTSYGDRIGWEMPVVRPKTELDSKPKIVVIMAGDDKPTYVAAPSPNQAPPFNHICTCGSQV